MNQSKAVAWDYIKLYTQSIPNMKWMEQTATARFPNGTTIRLFGADNADALRGLYFDGIVIDEVADMKPAVWGEIIRPALSDRQGWAIFIGTPKGINMFSELYYSALKNDTWYADLFRASETHIIPVEELEEARLNMSEAQYAQEFECDFNASTDNTLISVTTALEATKRHLTREDVEGSPRVLGVDVARYGDDRSVIFPRQGLIAFKPKVYRGLDNMTFASTVAQAIDKFKPDAVFIDAGRGEGVIDRLRQLNYQIVEVNFASKPANPHYQNKRAEMWDSLRIWLERGGMIPNDNELITDLCVPQYTYANQANKFQLESKDDIKKRGMQSVDLGDGLALTFAHTVAPKDSFSPDTGAPLGLVRKTGGKGMDYNPINVFD
jgi:hypothetical protein